MLMLYSSIIYKYKNIFSIPYCYFRIKYFIKYPLVNIFYPKNANNVYQSIFYNL